MYGSNHFFLKAAALVVNELHAQLREECRCDLSAATKWVVPSDCGGSQRTVHQSGSDASWQRGWRGLAQLHRSAVVLYTAMVWCAGYSGAAGRRRLGGGQYVGAMTSTKPRRRERGTSNAKASPHSVGRRGEAMLSATKIAPSSPLGLDNEMRFTS